MATNLTCRTCGVLFKLDNIYKEHYKSEWHCYNIKRSLANLSVISHDDFQKLVHEQRGNELEQDQSMYCEICRKSFNNKNSYENHLASKKHKEKSEMGVPVPKRFKQMMPQVKVKDTVEEEIPMDEDSDVETDSEVEEVSSDEWNEDDENNPINKNNCLFCPHHSRNFTMNFKHMTENHSFFIPDIEYCVDLKGMLLYLGAKIYEGHICIWCNDTGKRFASLHAVQKHMIDKGHCMVLHEGSALDEYTDYYDYSKSHPDANRYNADEEIEVEEIDGTDYQLTLPSGATIGHRSLMRYYKQSLDPKKGIVVQKKVQNVLSLYKNCGFSPMQKEAAQRKARAMKCMLRVKKKYYTQLGCKANKLQRHFRPQVNF